MPKVQEQISKITLKNMLEALDTFETRLASIKERYATLLTDLDAIRGGVSEQVTERPTIKLAKPRACISCGTTEQLIYKGPKCRLCYQRAWAKKAKRKEQSVRK